MFSFLKRNPHEKSIEQIESILLNSIAFRYFAKDNSNLLLEYKTFEIGLFTAALHSYLNELVGSKNDLYVDNENIKKIYFKRAGDFLRNRIKTGYLKFNFLDSGNDNDSFIILGVFSKFNRYKEEINDVFKTEAPFWVEEWDKPSEVEEYEFKLTGEKKYYNFLYKLLLSEVNNSDDGVKYIETKEIWDLDEKEYELLQIFIDNIIEIKKSYT